MIFSKFHGAGNDFIMVDNRDSEYFIFSEHVAKLCHRRFGIGADGLIILHKSLIPNVDFKMLYFNSDGNLGSMCGNGGRSFVAFLDTLGLMDKKVTFEAYDGLHDAEILWKGENEWLSELELRDVDNVEVLSPNEFFLDTGSPHLVVFVDNLNEIDITEMGRKLRYDSRFAPNGTNVNFVSHKNGVIFARTYERGVEDETLSCGTGVTASAIAAKEFYDIPDDKIKVKAKGGSFDISFKKEGEIITDIRLKGPVRKVYSGKVDLHTDAQI